MGPKRHPDSGMDEGKGSTREVKSGPSLMLLRIFLSVKRGDSLIRSPGLIVLLVKIIRPRGNEDVLLLFVSGLESRKIWS